MFDKESMSKSVHCDRTKEAVYKKICLKNTWYLFPKVALWKHACQQRNARLAVI
jgi:hypothetical protein